MAQITTQTAKNGVIVRVFDDCMSAPGSPEERRRIESQRKIAREILRGVYINGTNRNQRREIAGADV